MKGLRLPTVEALEFLPKEQKVGAVEEKVLDALAAAACVANNRYANIFREPSFIGVDTIFVRQPKKNSTIVWRIVLADSLGKNIRLSIGPDRLVETSLLVKRLAIFHACPPICVLQIQVYRGQNDTQSAQFILRNKGVNEGRGRRSIRRKPETTIPRPVSWRSEGTWQEIDCQE